MGGKTSVSQCLKAEFKEEALGNLMRDPRMKDEIQGKLNELFSDGVEVKILILIFWDMFSLLLWYKHLFIIKDKVLS